MFKLQNAQSFKNLPAVDIAQKEMQLILQLLSLTIPEMLEVPPQINLFSSI